MKKKITSVLVIDDSITSRALISLSLKKNKNIEVIGTASTPMEARNMILDLKPDVLTLDIEMPGMNGLQFLEKIMRLRPMPVIIVSSLVGAHAQIAETARQMGAFECFSKNSSNDGNVFTGLSEVIIRASQNRITDEKKQIIVGIGASTGGVEAITEVLSAFPENCPPTVIVQHMPKQFSDSFVRRLDGIVKPSVILATEACNISSGTVLIAPGGEKHMEIKRVGSTGNYNCHFIQRNAVNGHRPSVDVLFSSIAHAAGCHSIGVILTGMETDGAVGLLAMRKAGAKTIGQNKDTSVVYGMPKAAFDCGAVERQIPLSKIGPTILEISNNYMMENNYS